MSRQSPYRARALPCPCNLHTSAGADFFVAAIARLREHDRRFARPWAGEDRHLETAVVVSPVDVPVTGSLAILEQECRVVAGYAHTELTPANQLSLIAATAPSKVASHRVCKSNCGVGGAVWRPASSVSSNRRVIASHSTRP